ncbi:MAG: hypothetical protein KA408_08635 [Flavobacteriales bacterium]|nr:hypothetical protein [Flavobacteriales bacterium]
MNIENEFDALAKQKLEGRSIPFEQDHWSEMQAVLNARNKRKKRFGFWWSGGAALLLLIGGVWYFNGTNKTEDGQQNNMAEVITKNKTEEKTNRTTTTSATANNDNSRSEQNNTLNLNDKSSGDSISGATKIPNEQVKNEHSVAALKPVNVPAKHGQHRTDVKVDPVRPAGSIESEPNSIEEPNTSIDPKIGAVITQVPPDPAITTIEQPTFSGANDPLDNSSMAPPAQRGGGDPETDQTGTAVDIPIGGTTISPDPEFTSPEVAVGEGTESNMKDPGLNEEKGFTSNYESGVPPAFSDSTLTERTELPPDSSAVAQVPNDTLLNVPEPAVQLINPASPWEVSVLGGAMRTNTRYTGANSDTWNTAVQQQWSMNAGMEIMHIGRNFGLGAGLHYGTYSERISAKALDNTSFNVINFWYLVPVDTTILTITGTTTVDSIDYFTGISIDTTINVITRGSDSTAVTEHIRDAREIVNKVSYLEIPLLVDGHLVQGRWSLGVRGGPTIGLLTGRRGSLPNESGNGYTDFTDQPFREVVFGWTARAYVRYRFNAAWSIGVEPMMRGQFNNTLGNGDLSRRSSAFGCQLSLSYRLR